MPNKEALFDENRLLFEQNNEKTTRDSVKATVVGKAKIMCFEDIVEAQKKRDKKEVEKAQTINCGAKQQGKVTC